MDLERIVSLFNVNLDGCFFVDLLCNNDDVIEILDVFLMKFMLIICYIVIIFLYLEMKVKESLKIDEEVILI